MTSGSYKNDIVAAILTMDQDAGPTSFTSILGDTQREDQRAFGRSAAAASGLGRDLRLRARRRSSHLEVAHASKRLHR